MPLSVMPNCLLFQPRACIPHTPYTPQMSRLPEIYFSGSLLIKQGVGWVDKPTVHTLICWVTPAANPSYSPRSRYPTCADRACRAACLAGKDENARRSGRSQCCKAYCNSNTAAIATSPVSNRKPKTVQASIKPPTKGLDCEQLRHILISHQGANITKKALVLNHYARQP